MLLALAGCGRIGFDLTSGARDAVVAVDVPGADALAGCTQPGPWGQPELIAGLSGMEDLKLSADKRELYGVRMRTCVM